MGKEGNLVRSVSLQKLEEHTAELVAGKRVVDILPSANSSEPIWKDEEERLQAIDRVMEKLRRGYDLGGFKITDRDALYDRD